MQTWLLLLVFFTRFTLAQEQPKTVNTEPLKIAMSAAFVSEAGVSTFEEIIKYISQKTDLKVEIITGLSYQTINTMIEEGVLSGGFICGLPYVLLNEKKEVVQLLVAPVMKNPRYKNRPIYYSDLIVSKESTYHNFDDLRGKVFAFNEETSNSGYNLPRYFFLEKKLPKNFFKKIIRTGSHEESIRTVANKGADFSFVDSLVLEYEIHRKSKEALAVRVITSLGPAGIPPLVVSKKVPLKTVEKLKNAFLGMDEDPNGRKILDKVLVQRFESVSDINYQDIRTKYESAKSKKRLQIE